MLDSRGSPWATARSPMRSKQYWRLTDDPNSVNAKPVMAAIVAGLAGVAYVAVTGSTFLARAD